MARSAHFNSVALDVSPHLLTVVTFTGDEWRVTQQNARSRSWLGDLVAAPAGGSPGRRRGDDALGRLFARDPPALDRLLHEMTANGASAWRGLVRVAAPCSASAWDSGLEPGPGFGCVSGRDSGSGATVDSAPSGPGAQADSGGAPPETQQRQQRQQRGSCGADDALLLSSQSLSSHAAASLLGRPSVGAGAVPAVGGVDVDAKALAALQSGGCGGGDEQLGGGVAPAAGAAHLASRAARRDTPCGEGEEEERLPRGAMPQVQVQGRGGAGGGGGGAVEANAIRSGARGGQLCHVSAPPANPSGAPVASAASECASRGGAADLSGSTARSTGGDGAAGGAGPGAGAGAGESGGGAGPPEAECWHEVHAARALDPLTGRVCIVLTQVDVTAQVAAQRRAASLVQARRRLLHDMFPPHCLPQLAERLARAAGPARAPPPAATPGGSGQQPDAAGSGPPPRQPAAPLSCRGEEGCSAGDGAGGAAAARHPRVTLLFADIACGGSGPEETPSEMCALMAQLAELFRRFDALLDCFGDVTKVESVGSCYCVASGVAEGGDASGGIDQAEGGDDARGARERRQAQQVFGFAQAMLAAAGEAAAAAGPGRVAVRIGMHSGPVVSGLVGSRMPRFCLLGGTVEEARRLERSGEPGAVHASEATLALLGGPDGGPGGASCCWEAAPCPEAEADVRVRSFLWRPRRTERGARQSAAALPA